MTESSTGDVRIPNGRIDHGADGAPQLVITRRFPAPIEDVWASVTEPDRLERWIGTYAGDPASGRIAFRMTAEAADAPEEEMEILECDPPRLLAVRTQTANGPWHLVLALEQSEGTTEVTFSQPRINPTEVENVGPGWEYYLDRLVAAVAGGDVAAIDFERDYYPAMQEYYRSQI
jgi:uncharacterized protein YndB with AHSA1/START domain